MATLKHRTTGHTVTTAHAPEIVSLRAQGYADVPAETPTEAAVASPAPKGTEADSKPAEGAGKPKPIK